MTLKLAREKILARFTPKDVIGYSVGDFKNDDWQGLETDVRAWWDLYKAFERDDTLEQAYADQRLTVKGTSTLDSPIEAQDPKNWGGTQKFEKAKPKEKAVAQAYASVTETEYYRIKKTNASIRQRLDPKVFVPRPGADSRKTELGLHDLSAGLMNCATPLSEQQFKTPGPGQVYVFMPLSDAGDQAVFQNINTLAKAYRVQRSGFYALVRDIRSRMTRVKLAAEHDMATNFVHVGNTPTGRPKFQYSLIGTTDISVLDKKRKVEGTDVDFGDSNVLTKMPTTPGILEARRHAALNYQQLILGQMHSYGEVVVAYRHHAGKFPKFATFDKTSKTWKTEITHSNKVAETWPDRPLL
jgi:hypothetical protein